MDGCLSSCENMMIDRYCIDMWESVNVHFYLAALEKGEKDEEEFKQINPATVSSTCWFQVTA